MFYTAVIRASPRGQRLVVVLFAAYDAVLVLTACMALHPGWFGARSVEGATFWRGVFAGICFGVLLFTVCVYELHHRAAAV